MFSYHTINNKSGDAKGKVKKKINIFSPLIKLFVRWRC